MTSIDVPGRVAADNDRAARVDLGVRAVGHSHPLSRARHVAAAYLGLTKPRIIELLLVTTVPAMFLAAGGVPPLKIVLTTMV
ncbi:MAG TPA: protoheme IX farnesyltransferase, partial [Propionibacteriaceae bacterium]|nr:protoheme IX farnesyltransferase [Propionibacteriaceae bacterium]